MDRDKIRERYLRDNLAVRLGGLAANLRRIQSFTRIETNRAAVEGLIDESKFFIEWTAKDTDVETAVELIAIQVELARWQCQWENMWSSNEHRIQIAEQSRKWSDRVLQLSGLV